MTNLASESYTDCFDMTDNPLFKYWSSIRGDDLVPNRSDFRPADVLALLPSLMILEYRDPGELIFRLSGTGANERMGLNFTGMNLFDLVAGHKRTSAMRRFDALRRQPCGIVLHEKLYSRHRTPFIAELVYLPLRDREGEISQLIALASIVAREAYGAGQEASKLVESVRATYIDIGAGVPQQVRHEDRKAV